MNSEDLTTIILRGNLEAMSKSRLARICSEAIIEFPVAINDCINPAGVRLGLISADREERVSALYKIRGAIRERMHRDEVVARQAARAKRERREAEQSKQRVTTTKSDSRPRKKTAVDLRSMRRVVIN